MAVSNPTREDFAALLEESFTQTDLAEGYVAKGLVTAIEKDVAVIDVGLKVEGRVPLKEFGVKGKDGTLKVGDEVEVYVERIENALGEAVLSREKARREESWVKLEVKFEAGERVEGIIFNQVKGGFTVDLDGAVAFLPRSQVDIRPIRDVTPLMHNPQPFEILKMDRRRGNIVVSRRTVLEESRAEQRSEIVQNLEEGQVVEGVVKNITDYGAFVDLGGIDGLLHVTDIAWRRVNHPAGGPHIRTEELPMNSMPPRGGGVAASALAKAAMSPAQATLETCSGTCGGAGTGAGFRARAGRLAVKARASSRGRAKRWDMQDSCSASAHSRRADGIRRRLGRPTAGATSRQAPVQPGGTPLPCGKMSDSSPSVALPMTRCRAPHLPYCLACRRGVSLRG